MKSVPENIRLSKDQFPWSTKCLTLHPEFSTEAGGKYPCCSWANTLGKCQFVVATVLSFLELFEPSLLF